MENSLIVSISRGLTRALKWCSGEKFTLHLTSGFVSSFSYIYLTWGHGGKRTFSWKLGEMSGTVGEEGKLRRTDGEWKSLMLTILNML